jgi:hypothetical protein
VSVCILHCALLQLTIDTHHCGLTSAFCYAPSGSWLLIDFGLARRYTDEAGSHLPQRSDASFRGSTAYASVHAHKDEDLSRRDDLWSWLYMLTELLEGAGALRSRVWWLLGVAVQH